MREVKSARFRALVLDATARETLAGWLAALRRHIERAEEARGAWNVQIETHLSSALLGALHAIRDASAGLRSELLGEATEAIAPYFPRIGDARQAAAEFPAVLAFRDFTHGPPLATSIRPLLSQARETAGLLERMTGGGEFWRMPGE